MTFAFESVHDFLAMGHYGSYVWSAWLITAVGLGILIGHSRSARRQFYQRQALRMRQQQARQMAKKPQQTPSISKTDQERPS